MTSLSQRRLLVVGFSIFISLDTGGLHRLALGDWGGGAGGPVQMISSSRRAEGRHGSVNCAGQEFWGDGGTVQHRLGEGRDGSIFLA